MSANTFTSLDRDPHAGKTDTSAAAAARMAPKANTLRHRAFELVRIYSRRDDRLGLTADECADLMRESILAVRPRLSELRDDGLIEDTGIRRKNVSGNRQIVFRVAL